MIDAKRDAWWARVADYFIARGGNAESEVLTHEHECGCKDCRLLAQCEGDADIAIQFEERELAEDPEDAWDRRLEMIYAG